MPGANSKVTTNADFIGPIIPKQAAELRRGQRSLRLFTSSTPVPVPESYDEPEEEFGEGHCDSLISKESSLFATAPSSPEEDYSSVSFYSVIIQKDEDAEISFDVTLQEDASQGTAAVSNVSTQYFFGKKTSRKKAQPLYILPCKK